MFIKRHSILKSKFKNLLILSFLLSLLAVAAHFAIVTDRIVNAATSKPNLTGTDGKPPLVVGSIVKTKNPAAIKNLAEAKGLDVSSVNRLATHEFLVALSEPPFNPAVLDLKRQVFDIQITPNFSYATTLTPNDTNYSDQWNLPKISAPPSWDITTGSSTTNIAIIDTGVLFSQSWGSMGPFTQPDFPTSRRWENSGEAGALASNGMDDDGNGFIDDWQGWDFMGGFSGNSGCPNHNPALNEDDYIAEDNDPQPYSCDSPSSPTSLNKDHYNGTCQAFVSACFVGHGTMVASVAAAQTNNSALIAGIDHAAKIMNLRVLDGYGFTNTARVAAAVDYAGANGADVINLSLAVTDCSDPNFTDSTLEAALSGAKSAGAVTAAASGNENIGNVCYPASSTHTIAVGATNQSDNRASFSNYGSKLDVTAPGVDIPVANAPSAAINSNYFASADGTSLATPHVVGLASLMLAVDTTLSPDEIKGIITNYARRTAGMNGESFTNQYGSGRIDANMSVIVASGHLPVWRLYNGRVHNHLVTASPKERDIADKHLGFRTEGIVFWAVPPDYPGAVRVWRLYNGRVHNHLVTTSISERDFADQNLGFRVEGTVFWVVPSSEPGAKRVWRLYNGRVHNHLVTTSATERDFADQNLGFRVEGTVFWVIFP